MAAKRCGARAALSIVCDLRDAWAARLVLEPAMPVTFSFAAYFERRDEAAKAFYALLFVVTEGTRRRIEVKRPPTVCHRQRKKRFYA
jgi:hypothetical protein